MASLSTCHLGLWLGWQILLNLVKHSFDTIDHEFLMTRLEHSFDTIDHEFLMTRLEHSFDTIDHEFLMTRLEYSFGITDSALAWLRSYISERCQKVAVDSSMSIDCALKCGVPQGSALVPILYSI